jgi:WhiB family transcriptional regulator, redox-sensing transcriptional regulator
LCAACIDRDSLTVTDPGTEWMEQAHCRTLPDNLLNAMFFNNEGSRGGYAWTQHARKYCGECPVLAQCLDYALAHDVQLGFQGGHTRPERVKMARSMHGTWQFANRTECACTPCAKAIRRKDPRAVSAARATQRKVG